MRTTSSLRLAISGVSILACGGEDRSSVATGSSPPHNIATSVGGALTVTAADHVGQAGKRESAAGGNDGLGSGIDSGGTHANSGSLDSATRAGGSNGSRESPAASSCPPVLQRCPSKVLYGDITIDTGRPASVLAGVTELRGDLTIYQLAELDTLDCLETVTGDIEFSLSKTGEAMVLRNLREVGGTIMLSNSSHEDADLSCAFSSLQRVQGSVMSGPSISISGGFSGDGFDLSSVTICPRIELKNTKIKRLILPSHIELRFKELWLYRNTCLEVVGGFEQVKLTPVGNTEFSLYAVDNPLLSTCRLLDLKALLEAAGTTLNTISGNATDC